MPNGAPWPTVGRLVHWVMPNGAHRPALVVDVPDPDQMFCTIKVTSLVNDHPLDRDGDPYGIVEQTVPAARYSEAHEVATWHWPER